ncbi:MAG: phosphomethylpyrimidine synthase ThiC [Candidatus Lokiarchaeota archaeon]|nr:phosphomethylpyrimidine synthase ThiC [Candidatus Lokiarchaeota archaeon]
MKLDTSAIPAVAARERIDPGKLEQLVLSGSAVLMGRDEKNRIAIGKGLRTKVNVNLGTSPLSCDEAEELEKVDVARRYGGDTVSDCSTAGDIDALRRSIISRAGMPVTTIPVYQAVAAAGSFEGTTDGHILATIKKHVKDGAASVVIHAGFSLESLRSLKGSGRIMGIVSKGGSMTAAISLSQGRENPFAALFDDILALLEGTGVVLNLGNAMRSGCVHDLKDEPQLQEIHANARLAARANECGVQAVIEGLGGHVNAKDLKGWIEEHNRITGNRPLFVAGPLPTEVGLGYDHISAAIGGAMAAGYGADYLCAITPAEHLGLPNAAHVREGVVAARIAAHVGDSMKYGLGTYYEDDKLLALGRSKKDWHAQFAHAIDPDAAKSVHPDEGKECSMCGKYCAIAIMRKYGLDSTFDV